MARNSEELPQLDEEVAEDGEAVSANGDGVVLKRLGDIESQLVDLRRELSSKKLSAGIGLKVRDRAFVSVARSVLVDGRTLLGQDRLWILWQAVLNTAQPDVHAAEVGVFQGGSSFFLAGAFKAILGEEVSFHSVDTFEGHPAASISDADDASHIPGLFSETSYESVAEYLAPFEKLVVHKGAFPGVADELPNVKYALVHLDVDLYEPTIAGLRFFGERMRRGGVIVVDDFGSRKCPGVRDAVEEFVAESYQSFHEWQPLTEQAVLVRTS